MSVRSGLQWMPSLQQFIWIFLNAWILKKWENVDDCLPKNINKMNKLSVHFSKVTELTVYWPQPWCPLHAPKLLWSRLTKVKVGHKPEPKQAKVGRHRPKRVIWKKNAALVTCSSLCACSHVIIHPPIKSQVSRLLCCTCSMSLLVPVLKHVPVWRTWLRFFGSTCGFSHVVGTPVCTLSLTGCDQNGSSYEKRWGLFSAPFSRGGKSTFITQVEIQVLVSKQDGG